MEKRTARREDYLKWIYVLSQQGMVHGSDLADAFGVKRPTVSVFLKWLMENGDITMDKHRCIFLTEQGRLTAEHTVNKHSVLLALLRELGIPEQVANEDACAMEHSISPETFAAFWQLLQERQKGSTEK